MEKLTLREVTVPLIKSIDSFNFLLKSHHRRTAVISYYLGKALGLSSNELLNLVLAASLHDIGALSIHERDMLVKDDVINPIPHCIMGYRILSSFTPFGNIAQIIKHHHIHYDDASNFAEGEVLDQSHILHLADRVDIYTDKKEFILNQKNEVIEKVREKNGSVFHPDVFKAFEKAAQADIFWIEINHLDINQLFEKLDFTIDFDLSIDNLLDFVATISRIVDFRSKYTTSHSYNVAQLSSLIGSFFGFSEADCKRLMIAGYLHDIGNLALDPRLIEKNGPLSTEEFNKVKMHPYYTEQILSGLSTSDWFGQILKWAKYHHERTDGSGYPYGLRGAELDEGSKIIAFADIISALTEDKPYRKAQTIDEAFFAIENVMSESISPSMFNVIKEHKDEINNCIVQCQTRPVNEQ